MEHDITTNDVKGIKLMMQKIGSFLSLLVLLLSFKAYSESLKPGPWRFELKTAHANVPFIIEFHWKKNRLEGTLFNGKESIPLKDIVYVRDSLIIPIQTYEITLELKVEGKDVLRGELVRQNKNPKVRTPVLGMFGEKERFPGTKDKATINLTGRWAMTLTDSSGVASQGVGVFEQKDNYFTGSILTPTGDYRYCEGFVSANEFQCASFDGMYNYLLKGVVREKRMDAGILSSSITKVIGFTDSKAELPDAYKQTKLETNALNFKFPDLKGKFHALKDPQFHNKAVILQVFGSWCPNCLDEMNYLMPWYEQNKKRGVEIIALAFERSLDFNEAKKQLIKVKIKRKVPYLILQAGSTSDDKPMDKLPGLKNFISFPTTIFLNKKHEVLKVHAGFSGPSTGEFFEKWKKEFDENVNEILK